MAKKSNALARGWMFAASALALSFGLGATQKAEAIVTPDDVPPSDVVDTQNDRPYLVGLGIRAEAGNSGGTCSGLLINPRTVLFAAHCVDGLDPDAYDNNAPGDRAQVGYTTDPTFGRTNLRNWLFGQDFAVPPGDGRTMTDSVMVWYDPRSRFGPLADPNGGTFLPADIAIAGFDTPTDLLGRDAQDGIGLLFSRVRGLVPVTIGGYGQAGNGLTGTRLAGTEDTFFRRLATNMLGFLGSEQDLYGGTEPANIAALFNPPGLNYQDLYWMDFDDPQNRPFDATINANPGVTTTFDFNVFPDEPTANEAITAAGDSGSPLITDAYGREVSLGVLSQGSRFFHDVVGLEDDNFVFFPAFSDFGTAAGYNPLFLFWDQIVINNPYKYVRARAGNREWTDGETWIQELDPLYYTLIGPEEGRLINALPDDPALGSTDAAPNLGTINPNPAPIAECAFFGTCPATGGGAAPQPVSAGMPGTVALAAPSTPASTSTGTALWSDGVLLQLNSGPLTGPGSTGFVADNTNGTPGLQNSTRFFEVNLRNAGMVFVSNADIEIDRLNVRGIGAGVTVRERASLTSNLSSYLDVGRINVNGTFNTAALDIGFGVLSGGGTINAPGGVMNYFGVVSPSDMNVGPMYINGDYTQTGYGTVFYQIGNTGSDRLVVSGHADVSGNLLVQTQRRLRFGERFVVIQAGSVEGNFERTLGSGTLLFGRTQADADSVDLIIDAKKIAGQLSGGSAWGSLATALDYARGNGRYLALGGVFDAIDYLPTETLDIALGRIAPTNALQATPLAVGYTQDIMQSLDARSSELRAGVRGMSQRSVLNGMRIAQAGTTPEERTGLSEHAGGAPSMGDRFGVFVSGYGNVTALGDEAYEGDRFNPAHLTAMSSADLTVGADYRVNEHFAVGVASTLQRYLARDERASGVPVDHTGYGAMVYASAWDGAWNLDGYAGVAKHDFAMQRTPGFGFGDALDADQGAVQSMMGVRGGYSFSPIEGLSFGPTVGLNYSRLRFNAYEEAGTGDLALGVASRDLQSITVETAFQVAYQPFDNGRASPFAAYGRVGMVQELGDGVELIRAGFLAAPDVTFDIERRLDRSWVSAATGISYQLSDTASAHLEAASDMGRDDLSTTSLRAGFNWRF
ncbi:MAG: autotransporter domain-containing protein [Alphaproteobacteria bacterium]|nr:autotransporter domain-containing protein [Alphaproteobacteria bacterium]